MDKSPVPQNIAKTNRYFKPNQPGYIDEKQPKQIELFILRNQYSEHFFLHEYTRRGQRYSVVKPF